MQVLTRRTHVRVATTQTIRRDHSCRSGGHLAYVGVHIVRRCNVEVSTNVVGVRMCTQHRREHTLEALQSCDTPVKACVMEG